MPDLLRPPDVIGIVGEVGLVLRVRDGLSCCVVGFERTEASTRVGAL